MRRIIELQGGTVKSKVVSPDWRIGEIEGVTHVCLVLGILVASIPIGIDVQITQLCREPLGALLRGFGSLECLIGALLGGFGSSICGIGILKFHLIVFAGQFHVAGKVKR
jgi:hypothetical protein